MNASVRLFVGAVALFAASFTIQAQYYTIGPGGPSGYAANSVYTPGTPPPTFGPGATLVLAGPPPPFFLPASVVDALASGADAGNSYRYSAAVGTVGLPATPVAFQVAVGTAPSHVFGGGLPLGPTPPEVAGDIFSISGPVFGILALATPLAFAAPAFTDEYFLGLNVGPVVPDNLNALTYRAPVGPGFYYSLAPGAGPLPGAIFHTGGTYAAPGALGLDHFGAGTDDIDALLVQDLGVLGTYEPGIDFVAFSLAPGSATLAALGYAAGTGGADVFLPAVGAGLPTLFISGATFGLATADNMDALDVVPEPGVLTVFGLGVFLALGVRRITHRRVV